MLKTKGRKYIEINPKSEDGLRWIENINKGWRLIGFADEINPGISHRGWFTDVDFQDEVFRGIVYQLPTRKGQQIFFVGYADPNNSDAARGEVRAFDDKEDAGYAADSIAERCAEDERDYQEVWRLGQTFSDCLVTVETERETRKTLFAELRVVNGSLNENTPTLCKIIKDRIRKTRRNIRAAYDTRKEIVADTYLCGNSLDAFADGAGLTTEEVRALGI